MYGCGRFGANYGQIFRAGQPITAEQFNEEFSKCITDLQVAEGSGLTMSRFGRRVVISAKGGASAAAIPARVDSSSEVEADQEWDYLVVLSSTAGTAADGLADLSATTYPAKNRWEWIDKAGYENTSVTGIKKIPNNAPIEVYWGTLDGEPTLFFSERNEPKCGEE